MPNNPNNPNQQVPKMFLDASPGRELEIEGTRFEAGKVLSGSEQVLERMG